MTEEHIGRGEHYFVSDDKKSAYRALELRGYPTFMVVNREGQIIEKGSEKRPSLHETSIFLSELAK